MCTAAAGYEPTAVSCESITASVPSRIALATSATSARVGREECTIESSIWVAVIAGGDHHAVCGVDDRLGVLDRLGLLDLRDQRRARVLAHEGDVGLAAHEAQ